MGRLIDADALIELIQRDIETTSIFMNTAEKYDGSFEKLYGQLNALKNYKCIITDIPTAYDVEKVVAELEKEKEIHTEHYNISLYKDYPEIKQRYEQIQCVIDDAIDKVRKGGIE